MRRWLAVLVFISLAAAIAAQDNACPALQTEALNNIASRCADQAAGTLCLGHPTVAAIQRPPSSSAAARKPGDTLPVDSLDWLAISTEDRTWGAARAVFPAYAGDSLETREATLVAFGNVALYFPPPVEPPSPLINLTVTASRGAYLRAQPRLDAQIIAPLPVRTQLKAIGTSPNGNWRLVYAAPNQRGWMSQSVVSTSGNTLPVLNADSDIIPLWLPGQIFDFHSGIADAPCDGAWNSGILLQAPNFTTPTYFEINGIRVLLTGSVWLQAQISSGALIHVIDGAARVTAADVTRAVQRGYKVSVPLAIADDRSIQAEAAPTDPVPYDYQRLSRLPVHTLIQPSRVSLALYTLATPAPRDGSSPLSYMSSEDPCKIVAGRDGANLRSRPDPAAPIIAVMAYRDSALPVSRGIGVDSLPWWKLAESVWVRVDATSFAGNCNAIPLIRPGL
ncbi:MAG: SH3 domain-containing protein [Chloroflexi bacterium]|nr:SH3 domain-containing protein [Chloroflexota bacterium]